MSNKNRLITAKHSHHWNWLTILFHPVNEHEDESIDHTFQISVFD